jgi:hypothetical protein
MNAAEAERDKRIAAFTDIELLSALLEDEELVEGERVAFDNMRESLTGPPWRNKLTAAQRTWAEKVMRRIMPLDARLVPRGKEVLVPDVLRHLPKDPPGRKKR